MKSLNSLKKQELLDLAKSQNLPATTKMTKDQLIELINNPPTEKVAKAPAKAKADKSEKVAKAPAKAKADKSEKVAKAPAKAKADKSEKVAKAPAKAKADKSEKVAKAPAKAKADKSEKVAKAPVKAKADKSEKVAKVAKSTKIVPPTRDIIATFDNNITILMQSHDTALIIWNADPTLDHQVDCWRFQNEKGLNVSAPSYARSMFVDISLLQLSDNILNFILYRVGTDGSQEEYTHYYTTTFREYRQYTLTDLEEHFAEYSKIQTRFNS